MKNTLLIGSIVLGAVVFSACSTTSIDNANTNLNENVAMENSNVNAVLGNSNQNSSAQSANIRNISIAANSVVSSPLEVTGEAKGWFFEGSFPMQIEDANGQQLYMGPVQAEGDWMQEGFVPFRTQVTFSTPSTPTGRIIFMNDNPSGLPENAQQYILPVTFTAQETPIKLFFQTNKGLPACDMVTAVTRIVPMADLPRTSLNELLRGPLLPEKENGAITTIPVGVTLQDVTINNDTATVNLLSTTEITNSCQKTSIKAQIEQTLKQFPAIMNVEVRVNGVMW